MTVKELIEKLQKFDPGMIVVVDGYEGGVNDVSTAREIDIILNCHDEWYYGKHEIPSMWSPDEINRETVKAVYLPR
jgi:hypothetical protein